MMESCLTQSKYLIVTRDEDEEWFMIKILKKFDFGIISNSLD